MTGSLEIDPAIVTPATPPPFLARLLAGPMLPGLAARLGAALARHREKPFRLGGRVIAARHEQVRDLLQRDEDFGIAAVNAAKIEEVDGGPFILGMDRSPVHAREHKALYDALDAVDMAPLRRAVADEVDRRLAAVPPGGEIDVVGGYARLVAAHNAQRLFGLTGIDDGIFMEVVRSIFGHTFLNLADDPQIRDRAIRAGAYMQRWFAVEIARRRAAGETGADMMGRLMAQAQLDDDGIRRTLGGLLVGSIDTTASCVAKIVTMLGRDGALASVVAADVNSPELMDGWCNEILRRWPHNPIVLRKARRDSVLGGATVKAGASVIAWTQAAMQDRNAFPEPWRLRPDRDPGAYLHLGAGVHPCSGRPINAFQIPLLVGGLLRRGLAGVGRVEWAGPFPNRLVAWLVR